MKRARFGGWAIWILPCFLLGGCATSALWQGGEFDRFHEPAKPAQLRLFQSAQVPGDVLVAYDESREEDDRICRRAYWLKANSVRIRDRRKPCFVSFEGIQDLQPIPVFEALPVPLPDSAPHLYAVAPTNSDAFVLYGDSSTRASAVSGQSPLNSFELPVYTAISGRVWKVALSPLTVTADATVIGGVIVYYCLPVFFNCARGTIR